MLVQRFIKFFLNGEVEKWNRFRMERPDAEIDLSTLIVSRGTNLSRINLSGANLAGVRFEGVWLTRAVMTGANLTKAVFTDCYLTDANLENANLTGSALWQTRIEGANFKGARFDGAILKRVDHEAIRAQGVDLSKAEIDPIVGIVRPLRDAEPHPPRLRIVHPMPRTPQ